MKNPNGQSVKIAPIYLDNNWTDSEREALKEAIRQWNDSLNGYIVLEIKDEHYHVTYNENPGFIYIKTNAKHADDDERFLSLAWTYGRGKGVAGNRIYFVEERIPLENLTYVALHEIGHTLGAAHVEESGLMQPIFDRALYNCIDRAAVLQVASFQHIPTTGLKWCDKH